MNTVVFTSKYPKHRRKSACENRYGFNSRHLNKLGINRVLITCDKDNAASSGVAKNNGGVLENEIYSEHYGCIIQRWWITPSS